MSKLKLIIIALLFSVQAFADNSDILGYFQKVNPEIKEVQVIEYVSNYHFDNGILVVRGIKPVNSFTGNWSDELFGIFTTNKNMEIVDILEFIPTKRWHDYCVEVKREKLSHFIVRFHGCSYNDQEVLRRYIVE